MRKAITAVLVLALCLAFGSAMVYAGDGCSAHKTADQTAAKSACTGSDVTAKLVSADKHCPYAGTDCGVKCTPEECAEWAKMCEKHGENAEIRMISVKGMTCTGCENSIKATLTSTPGVLEVAKVSYKDGMAVVIVDKTKAKNEALTTSVVNKGYEAQIIPAVAKTTDNAQVKKASGDMPSCAATCTKPCTGDKKDAKSEKDSH